MANIVFYGDSITDCGRNREDCRLFSSGYPAIVAGRLGLEKPEENVYFNRGISGNRIVDLYAQINGVHNDKPDVLSILIGVNDVWHRFSHNNGVDTEKFEMVYTLLLDELLKKNPGIKIMLLEPFVSKGSGTEATYDDFRADVEEKAAVVKKLAEKYNIPFIPLQEDFDRLYNPENPGYWLRDGVHPTPAGHTLIADKWIATYKKYFAN